MVRRTGVEPALTNLKGWFPRPLEDRRILGLEALAIMASTFSTSPEGAAYTHKTRT